MDIEKLAGQFVVDDEFGVDRLGRIIEGLLPYCVINRKGAVEIMQVGLSAKQKVKLVLAARLAASKMPGMQVQAEVTAPEIAEYTGLPQDQAAARAKDCFDEKFAERAGRGSYRARQHKIDGLLASLGKEVGKGSS
jgi:hypothetical protein